MSTRRLNKSDKLVSNHPYLPSRLYNLTNAPKLVLVLLSSTLFYFLLFLFYYLFLIPLTYWHTSWPINSLGGSRSSISLLKGFLKSKFMFLKRKMPMTHVCIFLTMWQSARSYVFPTNWTSIINKFPYTGTSFFVYSRIAHK